MNLELTDKTALVSGSTKGIGFAIASQLAAEGARVIVNGRSEKAVGCTASLWYRIRAEHFDVHFQAGPLGPGNGGATRPGPEGPA